MNANNRNLPNPAFASTANLASQPARRERRERDFGIGYGSSSGYGTEKRYASDWGLTRFRFS